MLNYKPDTPQSLYLIHSSTDEIFLQNEPNPSNLISINIQSNAITEIDQMVLKTKIIYYTIKAKAILGIIQIYNIDFLLYVKSSQLSCTIENQEVYQIKEIDALPLANPLIASNLSSEYSSLIDGIKNLLELGFFYSFGYDLTSSKQKQQKAKTITPSLITLNPLRKKNSRFRLNEIFDTIEPKFAFNSEIYKKFLINETTPLNRNFIIPVICGYVNAFEETVNGKKLKFVLITRRSKHHAGTRYNTRGIDDEGHCANYCETEQIVYYDNNILSFTQVRGSVPVFFRQTGMTAQTEITRNSDLTSYAFNKHFSEIQKDFDLVYCINLLNRKKGGEQILTNEFETQIRNLSSKTIKYYFFDMQNECKFDNYDKIDYLIQQIEMVVNLFQFYCENEYTHEVYKSQSGTIRVNCLDCLDRTNVIQMRISWLILEIMLKSLNVETEGIFRGNSFFTQSDNRLKEIFKDIWAENGDYISVQYAGTASTITTVTKNGGHTFFGLIQHSIATVTRVYHGSLQDYFKQECFNAFLQKDISHNIINPEIENELRKQEERFTKYQDWTVYIGSWNIEGKEIHDSTRLVEWLLPSEVFKNKEERPDLYIIGFQEIVDLNAKNIVLGGDTPARLEKWKNLISDTLSSFASKNEPYILVEKLNLVGIYLLTFIKQSKKNCISKLDVATVKSGLLGNMGNKGSAMMRFNINDSTLAIACNHLHAGEKKKEVRRSEMLEILNKRFDKYPKDKFQEHDFNFFFGDLNSRSTLDIEQCVRILAKKDIKSLLAYDQLIMFRKETTLINQMDEGKINFLPTYKYKLNSNEYDTTKRVPSYCDRILFNKNKDIEVKAYNRCEYNISDHKPIYGVFSLRTKSINKEERDKIVNMIKEKYEHENNEKSKNKNNSSKKYNYY